MNRRRIIIVTGSGVFPIDMLRYDKCWPRSQTDALEIVSDRPAGSRRIELLTDSFHITPERWESFSWTVISFKDIS